MIRSLSSDSLSLNAIQRKIPMMVGKISGVIKVANRNDFFFTRARYSLLITNRILCMVVFFNFLDKDITDGRHDLFKTDHRAVAHQLSQHLIRRGSAKRYLKTDVVFELPEVRPVRYPQVFVF